MRSASAPASARGALSLTWFDNRYADFIETVTVGVDPAGLIEFQPQNLTKVRIHGAELAGDAALGKLFRLRGSFAWIDGKDQTADVPLNSIQPTRLVLGLQLHPPGSRYGAELVSTLVDRKDHNDVDTSAVNQFAPPGYHALDLTSFVDLTSRLTLQVGLFNLLNEKYWEWADVQGISATSPALDRYTSPGFAASTSLRWRW